VGVLEVLEGRGISLGRDVEGCKGRWLLLIRGGDALRWDHYCQNEMRRLVYGWACEPVLRTIATARDVSFTLLLHFHRPAGRRTSIISSQAGGGSSDLQDVNVGAF
jgi:hypothetical protein